LLRHLSCHFRPNEITAIIGPSGSGKSTLAALLLGLVQADRGQILIDGTDLNAIDLAYWRSRIGYVEPEPWLIPGSLSDNVLLGKANASQKAVRSALWTAAADDFSERLPQGLETPVEEEGVALSGGQRQRVALARALLRDAPVLIFDEPTAALDNDTEASVLKRLAPCLRTKTTIIITHRRAVVEAADQVLMLYQGHVKSLARSTADFDEAWRSMATWSKTPTGEEM